MKINLRKYQQLFFLILVIIIVIGLNYGLNYLNLQNSRQKRQKLRQTQNQIMQDFWKTQGLSDQEIQQKIKRNRIGNRNPEQTQQFKQKMQQSGGDKNVRNIMRMTH